MKNANKRDVVAIIELAAMLEDGLSRGEHWDELKVTQVLENFSLFICIMIFRC